MPGKSNRTRPTAVRLTPHGHHMLAELARVMDCPRSEAHKRALAEGIRHLMTPMQYATAKRTSPAQGVNTP